MNEIVSRVRYPNPFTPSGIEFELREDSIVTLQLHDNAGILITTVINKQEYSAGKHTVDFTIPTGKIGLLYRLLAVGKSGERIDTKEFA